MPAAAAVLTYFAVVAGARVLSGTEAVASGAICGKAGAADVLQDVDGEVERRRGAIATVHCAVWEDAPAADRA